MSGWRHAIHASAVAVGAEAGRGIEVVAARHHDGRPAAVEVDAHEAVRRLRRSRRDPRPRRRACGAAGRSRRRRSATRPRGVSGRGAAPASRPYSALVGEMREARRCRRATANDPPPYSCTRVRTFQGGGVRSTAPSSGAPAHEHRRARPRPAVPRASRSRPHRPPGRRARRSRRRPARAVIGDRQAPCGAPGASRRLAARRCRCRARSRMAALASSSQRSFSGCPSWPRTQCQRTLCACASASSARHRSSFFTGLRSAVRQPLRFQRASHSDMPVRRYCESVCRSTVDGHPAAHAGASMAAISSMRLLVVDGS